jgi:ADP-ribose pyrophosphatase YjhB (NUDIX family)
LRSGSFTTVDIVLLALLNGVLHAALPVRDREPFAGRRALVGGFVHTDEDRTLEDAAARILPQKAGMRDIYVEQLGTFGGADRDPRGWSVGVAYLALVPHAGLAASAVDLGFTPVDRAAPLPFDYDRILVAAVARLRRKGAYSTLPVRLLGKVFTLGEMDSVYEQVMGTRIDQSSFRRKVLDLDIVEEIEKKNTTSSKRPSRQFRLKGTQPEESTFDRSLV